MPSKTSRVLFTSALSVILGILALTMPLFAVSVKTLYSFCSSGNNCPDGSSPFGGVILDSAGNLYGTTYWGGTGQSCSIEGCGTVFELIQNSGKWTERVLYSFCSASNCTDGAQPGSGMIFDKAGNLYGTTYRGGAYGLGTIFELTPANGTWTEKVLYSFGANSVYPASPVAIIFGKDGNLYGTTLSGGTGQGCFTGGCGTVFELLQHNGQWTGKVLHNFDHNGEDGFDPFSGVIFDSTGNLYGTTNSGGADDSGCNGYGCGTVYELSPGTNGQWTEKILHSFYNNGTDGTGPNAGGVVFDSAGNLYGTTQTGGADSAGCDLEGCGTVFELSPGTNGQWTEKVLHSFFLNGQDGVYPNSLLVGARALYGATGSGGAYGSWGTLFELTPSNGQWTEKVLYSFSDSGQDGALPSGSLTRDKAGNGYGTTSEGGSWNNGGVVFEVTP